MPTSGSALRCASVRIGLSGDAVSQLAASPPITVKQGAVLLLAYAQPQDFSLLQLYVDDNGDGIVDRTIPFEPPVQGDAVDDTTPPTSTVQLDHFVDANGQKLVRGNAYDPDHSYRLNVNALGG